MYHLSVFTPTPLPACNPRGQYDGFIEVLPDQFRTSAYPCDCFIELADLTTHSHFKRLQNCNMLSPVSSKDPYTVLSISPNASADEIKQAYKRLALKWHPDRHFSDKGRATRHFIEISNAYRDLVREKRAQIDEQIPPERQRTSSNPPIAPFSSSGSPSNASSSAPSPSASVSSFGSYIHVFASSADSLEYATSPSSYQPSIHSSTKVPQDNQQSTFEPRIGNPHSLFHPTQPSYEHDQESVDNVPPTEHLSNSFRPRTTKASPSKQWPFRPFSNLTRRQSKKSNDASSPYSVLTPTTRPYSSSWYASRLGTNNVLPPPQYGLRLQSLGLGPGDEWVYSLPMTLEELYNGKRCRFGITRVLFSGKRKNVIIEINIPPGCHSGTKVLCRNIGYERKDGSFQDIAFIIEEELHPRFTRSHDDLIMDIRLPWDDDLRREGGRVSLQGLDGQNINFHIDYPRDRAMKGLHTVVGAGMPIRNTGGSVLERGNLFIQWEILPPRTRVLQFMKRIWSTQR